MRHLRFWLLDHQGTISHGPGFPSRYRTRGDGAHSGDEGERARSVDAESPSWNRAGAAAFPRLNWRFIMTDFPNPDSIPAVLPSDFVKDDIPAETDDLQLGHKTPENPDSDPIPEPGRAGGSKNDRFDGRQR